MINKIKIIHVHTDYKFIIPSLPAYEGKYFENKVLVIEGETEYNGGIEKNVLIYKRADIDNKFNEIIKICSENYLVVLWGLDKIKCKIALSLPEKVKIAWRFFGYELYGRKKDLFLSEKSKAALRSSDSELNLFLSKLKKVLKPTYYMIAYGRRQNEIFYKAMKRITYFIALSSEEYQMLLFYWPLLPKFVKAPSPKIEINGAALYKILLRRNLYAKEGIVIGNSRQVYNNHFDIIELIDACGKKIDYQYNILFSYGGNGLYQERLINSVKEKNYFNLIEDFLSAEEFINFYKNTTALVINAYRQMAGANINLALKYGVKVYLNERNIHYHYLKNEGFEIFTIEDFNQDLHDKNLSLNYDVAYYNLKRLKGLSEKYSISEFQKTLYEELA